MNAPVELTMGIFYVALTAILGVVAYLMPRLTRPDLYFAVTVQPEFRRAPEGERILGHYRLQIQAHTLIALVIIMLAWVAAPAAGIAGFLWLGGGTLAAFLRARQQVRPHAVLPATVREAPLEPSAERVPGGWILPLLPFAILAWAAIHLQIHWSQIPDRFPVHWDLEGRPNGWATRSLAGVYWPLFMGATLTVLLVALVREILHGTRRIHVGGAQGDSEVRFRRAMVWITLSSEYLLAVMFAWVGLLPLRPSHLPGPEANAVVLLALAFTIAVVAVMAHVGQGGSALRPRAEGEAEPSGAPFGDRTEDRYWKAGIFYVNRQDAAILVEKRFGFGYTLNFGHPATWVILGGLLVLLVLVPALVARHSQ